jgi:hypothetical protein
VNQLNENINETSASTSKGDTQNEDELIVYDDNNDLDKFYEIPTEEILEIYRESSSEYNFAVRLCKRLFKKNELISKNLFFFKQELRNFKFFLLIIKFFFYR